MRGAGDWELRALAEGTEGLGVGGQGKWRLRPMGQTSEWALDGTRYCSGDKAGSLLWPCGSLRNVKRLAPAQGLVSLPLTMGTLTFRRRGGTLVGSLGEARQGQTSHDFMCVWNTEKKSEPTQPNPQRLMGRTDWWWPGGGEGGSGGKVKNRWMMGDGWALDRAW